MYVNLLKTSFSNHGFSPERFIHFANRMVTVKELLIISLLPNCNRLQRLCIYLNNFNICLN